MKVGCSFGIFLNSANLISRSVSESPFDLEITRVTVLVCTIHEIAQETFFSMQYFYIHFGSCVLKLFCYIIFMNLNFRHIFII